VRASTPSSPAVSSSGVRTATPARWPAARGSQRAFAQRPLPSMMMAMCRGVFSRSRGVSTRRSAAPVSRIGSFFWAGFSRASYLEKLGFLIRQSCVDAFGALVGHLLELGLRPALVVLGDLTHLHQRTGGLAGSVASCAPRSARGWGAL